MDTAFTVIRPFSTSTKSAPFFTLYRGRHQLQLGTRPGSRYIFEPEAAQGALRTDCTTQSRCPARPLPGVRGQDWGGRAFPAHKRGCPALAPDRTPGPGEWGPSRGPRGRGPQPPAPPPGGRLSWPAGPPWASRPRGGAGRGRGPRWGGRRVRSPRRTPGVAPAPRCAGPPPPPRSPSRAARRRRRDLPDKFPAARRRAAAQAAPGPRGLRASPRASRAPGGDGGAPRRAAGGRPGDAEPPRRRRRRRDRRDRTGPPEVSACGVRAGDRVSRAAGAGWGHRLGRAVGGRGRAGVPGSELGPCRPAVRRVPASGDRRTPAIGPPGAPSPTWRPGRRLSRSFSVN